MANLLSTVVSGNLNVTTSVNVAGTLNVGGYDLVNTVNVIVGYWGVPVLQNVLSPIVNATDAFTYNAGANSTLNSSGVWQTQIDSTDYTLNDIAYMSDGVTPGYSPAYYFANTPPPNQWAQATLSSLDALDVVHSYFGQGVALRASGTTATAIGYYIGGSPQGTCIMRLDAGPVTNVLKVDNTAWSNGDVLYAQIVGTVISVSRNGTLIPGMNTTDSTVTGGFSGLLVSGNTAAPGGVSLWSAGQFSVPQPNISFSNTTGALAVTSFTSNNIATNAISALFISNEQLNVSGNSVAVYVNNSLIIANANLNFNNTYSVQVNSAISTGGFNTPTVLQTVKSGAANSIVLTVNAGSTLLVAVRDGSGVGAVGTLSDNVNAGNYTVDGNISLTTDLDNGIVFRMSNTKSGTLNLVYTSISSRFVVTEVSNLVAVSPLDLIGNVYSVATTTLAVPINQFLAQQVEFVFASMYMGTDTGTWTSGEANTLTLGSNGTGTTKIMTAFGTTTNTSPFTYRTGSFGGSSEREMIVATYKATQSSTQSLSANVNMFVTPFMSGFQFSNGFPTYLQAHLARNRISMWEAVGVANTSIIPVNGNPLTIVGTSTARSVLPTPIYQSSKRLGVLSAATAGANAQIYLTVPPYMLGNAAGTGGFHYVSRVSVCDPANVPAAMMILGLSNTVTQIANAANVQTMANVIAVAQIPTSNYLFILFNNANATACTVNTGLLCNVGNTNIWETSFFAAPNSSNIFYQVTDVLNPANTFAGVTTAQLPLGNTMLTPMLWRTNNTQAAAVGLDVHSVYVETPL